MKQAILIIDDENSICTFLSLALEDEFEVFTANSSAQAFACLKRHKVHLVLLDLILGEENGLEILSRIKENWPEISVIMMTAFGDISTSVEAIKRGAFHYLCKPINMEELLLYSRQALEFQHLSRRVESLSSELVELEQRTYYGDIVGKSLPMQKVYQLIDRVKDVDASVIISGESGTGKELVARAIHRNGLRRNENFVSINCAAIPEGLLEEEFFGHVKGSFTGAVADKKGKLELADHGTLFLDEVGDMPLGLQGKLLRVLQEKEMTPIGGMMPKKVDIRVICATNKDLPAMVKEGTFRMDLYYRLHVINIPIPPLRERKQDIPDLCRSILKGLSSQIKRSITGISPEAERILLQYSYPGNVRELINILEYACVLCNGETISVRDLPEEISRNGTGQTEMTAQEAVKKYLGKLTIRDMEKLMVINALEEFPQSKRAAAKQLGISERTLFYKIQEFDL